MINYMYYLFLDIKNQIYNDLLPHSLGPNLWSITPAARDASASFRPYWSTALLSFRQSAYYFFAHGVYSFDLLRSSIELEASL